MLQGNPLIGFDDVPDGWKVPFGRYKIGPAGTPGAGRWWFWSLFNEEPWGPPASGKPALPAGFEKIFGPDPRLAQTAILGAADKWLYELARFNKAGLPDGAFSPDMVAQAEQSFPFYHMGKPYAYELTAAAGGNLLVRFPDSGDRDIVYPALLVYDWDLGAAEMIVALFQIKHPEMFKESELVPIVRLRPPTPVHMG